MSNTVRVYKDGAVEQIETASLDKFLAMGWTTKGKTPAKKKPKAKLKAKGEVKPAVDNFEDEIIYDVEEETKEFEIEQTLSESGPDDETINRITEEN